MTELPETEAYRKIIDIGVAEAYDLAKAARAKGLDPEDKVDIPLVTNMAERVEGIISVVAPQIIKSGVSQRIKELEKEYAALDWRVAFRIALEVAQEKYCKFKDKIEAMEIGIRTGFAYITMGVVASPLEGFVNLDVRKTAKGTEYIAANYAGPVRSAGGTGASVGVLIADYVRKQFGYDRYDPTPDEVERTVIELYDYHERIANLQYLPSEEEIRFLAQRIPIQIDGDGSEKIEVSRYKNLPRIEANRIRNGICLVIGEGIAQKAPKLWAQLSKWGKDFGMEWEFLGEFVELQKKIKAKGGQKAGDGAKVKPDYTYIKDLAAGRPVLTHPMRAGGFRLRYGRARTSGYSSNAIHPATMEVLDSYIATGTQLKAERPGKGCTVTHCDSLEGPIIKLKNGNVIRIYTREQARQHIKEIEEILFLGDMLVNYGDFYNRAHLLVPPGYCEEWWALEVEKATVTTFGSLDFEKLAGIVGISAESLEAMLRSPNASRITAAAALSISKSLNVPLHPAHTAHWGLITAEQLIPFLDGIEAGKTLVEEDGLKKIVIPKTDALKAALDCIGMEHLVASNEFIVFEKDASEVISTILGVEQRDIASTKELVKAMAGKSALEAINSISSIKLRDKSGIFIGARMGRPEKAKQRELVGSPHTLFPVGDEGGRLRSFQAALEAKKVTADFPLFKCDSCNEETIYPTCEVCGAKTRQRYSCKTCGVIDKKCSHEPRTYRESSIDIARYFTRALKRLGIREPPELVKGIRGTASKSHLPENPSKGILRSKWKVYVNKDGTTRFDMTQLPITHFKPEEVGTSVERLRELGYDLDCHGRKLEDASQVLEIKPQDIILPMNFGAADDGADKVLFRTAGFIDELLEKLYCLKPFYKLKSHTDLAGHLVLCLAPHTSSAIVGRIIGFSQTQGFFAHPMLHAATRRDCLDYNTTVPLFYGGNWHLDKIGEFVESLKPTLHVDSHGTVGAKPKSVYSLSLNTSTNSVEKVKVDEFTKHAPAPMVEVSLEAGKRICTTSDHKFLVPGKRGIEMRRASELKLGDKVLSPYDFNIKLSEATTQKLLGSPRSKASLKVLSTRSIGARPSYCLNLKHHNLIADGILVKNCDGDEACVTLLLDALLNFSRNYLPAHRGSTQDAPLVLTTQLIATEVDDMFFDLDTAWRYPLEFYNYCLEYKSPREITVIERVAKRLGTGNEYAGLGYTHETDNINNGVKVSVYKTMPTMEEKVNGQMKLANIIRAVDKRDVARLVIEKHFIRDTKGNLRKFSMQEFRCVSCNEKYRRPPLIGKCKKCGGKILFTISEGSIIKYLALSIKLAKDYDTDPYLQQSLELLRRRVEELFGKDEEKQEGLGAFMK